MLAQNDHPEWGAAPAADLQKNLRVVGRLAFNEAPGKGARSGCGETGLTFHMSGNGAGEAQ